MPYLVATTYFKLLKNDPLFLEMVRDSPNFFDDIDFKAPYVAGDKLDLIFDICAAHNVDSWLLSFANQASAAAHGPLGFAILCAPDLNTALNVMANYAQTRISDFSVKLNVEAKYAYLSVANNNDSQRNQRWLLEAAVFACFTLLEGILSQQIAQHAYINFSFPKPSYANQLEKLLGVRCQFNQKQTSIRFASSLCRMPSPLSDPDIHEINIQKCRKLKLLLQTNDNLVQHLQLTFDSFFATSAINKSPVSTLPSLDVIANDLNMSSRTLARHLELEQSSYKYELQKVRQRYAKKLLKETHLRVAQIAEILAYNETSNFVRAFKTWFDMPPSKWRKTLND